MRSDSFLGGAIIGWVICALLASEPAFSREDLIPGSRYTSARGAALGDAFLPLGEDVASGLFYNPAVLGKLHKTELEPLNVSLSMNSGYFSLLDTNFYKVSNLSGFAPTLQKMPGQFSNIGGSYLPSFGFPGFAFGILMQSQLGAQFNGGSSYTYKSLYQMIPTMGTGVRLAGGMVRLGYTLQWVNQASGSVTASSSTGTLGYNESLAQGSALSHNVGMALVLPIQTLPSFNFVARNIFGANYNSFSLFPFANNPTSVPATEPMTLDSSISIQPRLGRGTILNLVLEYRDMTNQSGAFFIGHMALGTELSFRDKIYLRAGWGSGYPSLGFGLRKPGASIGVAWYTEEIGPTYLSNGDSRLMVHYQVRAF